MARAGDELEIDVAGRIVFRRTAEETGGELLEFDYFLAPQRVTGAEHAHPKQEERFQVLAGRVRGHVDGEERTVSAGEEAVMPAGAWHLWWNDGDEEAHLLVEVRPALRTEQFYEAMSQVKVLKRRGIPNPIHGAVVMREYGEEQRFKRMQNPFFAKVIFPVFTAIGKLLGYSARPREA